MDKKEDGLSSNTVFLNWFCFGMQILHRKSSGDPLQHKQKCTLEEIQKYINIITNPIGLKYVKLLTWLPKKENSHLWFLNLLYFDCFFQ